MKLKQNRVATKNSDGKSSIHNATSMVFAPSEIKIPQLVSGG
jgi:hypothetical protein